MQETSTFLPDSEVLRPLLLEVFWICFVASHADSENKDTVLEKGTGLHAGVEQFIGIGLMFAALAVFFKATRNQRCV